MKRLIIIIALIYFAGPVSADSDLGLRLVNAARMQIGITVSYDPAYRVLEYPNGDVPADRGVCTDVIVRAFRTGLDLDLQKLVHEDMKLSFKNYPAAWGLKTPDKNIDHRRVGNLETYFAKRGWAMPVSGKTADYLPGDLVTCIVPPNLPHIMIVSDEKTFLGRPEVIHNIGAGAKEEDRLFDFKLTGHYRITGLEKKQ